MSYGPLTPYSDISLVRKTFIVNDREIIIFVVVLRCDLVFLIDLWDDVV